MIKNAMMPNVITVLQAGSLECKPEGDGYQHESNGYQHHPATWGINSQCAAGHAGQQENQYDLMEHGVGWHDEQCTQAPDGG